MAGKNAWPQGRKRLVVLLLALALLVALAAMGGGFLRGQYIKRMGIDIKPARDAPFREVSYYLQNDPEWAEEEIGGTRYRMAGYGCLLSCAASAMTDLGVILSPQELNEKMTAVDGFRNGDLLWYKINEAAPQVDYRYSRVFSGTDIDRDLAAGLLPIVKVHYNGGFAQHWVVVVGARDGEYYVYDPLYVGQEAIPLSRHGKVYAYRVLAPADGNKEKTM